VGSELCIRDRLKQAGLPDGVFNVVQGDKEAVDALLVHPDVKAVSFVGSTPIANYIYETGAHHGKRVQALGGAKNHMVVLPDADMELAADAVVSAAYGSAGERCMAISVLVAVGDAGDKLIPKVMERLSAIKVGSGVDPKSEMGPLVTKEHLDRVRAYVDSGVKEGAKLLRDGRDVSVAGHEKGFFLGPCLLDGVEPRMKIYQDEIFGPVLSVVRAGTYDEASGHVKDNPPAHGVAPFTQHGGAGPQIQKENQVGSVGLKLSLPLPQAKF
jgi:malonate-semialdehyde dehydrogenase (acetylating)/methylmalonate-semialdehyde dehydrogenase